jgi:hypothetical protein
MLKQTSTNTIFQLDGGSEPVSVQFTLGDRNVDFVNEVGVFLVDDDLGTINGDLVLQVQVTNTPPTPEIALQKTSLLKIPQIKQIRGYWRTWRS